METNNVEALRFITYRFPNKNARFRCCTHCDAILCTYKYHVFPCPNGCRTGVVWLWDNIFYPTIQDYLLGEENARSI
jgi:hypothetical protein